MKSICFFISSIDETGGTGRVCTAIANKLAQSGYLVTILSMYGNTPFFDLHTDINVQYVFEKKHSYRWFLPWVLVKLQRRFAAVDADIMINVDTALFIYSFVAGIGLNFKNIAWEHFNLNVTLNSKIRVVSRRLAARYSSAIITLSNADNANWTSTMRCRAPVYTINNPLPFLPINNKCKKDNNTVISVGRLTHQKGFDRLLQAWKILVTNNNITEWKLQIIGSGELHSALEQQIKEMLLEDTVKLIPATNNIEHYYKQADIYCMASYFEGFPMVLLEGQAYGLPLVSFDCETGPAEIINAGSGILVNNGDIIGLANALEMLILDKAKRECMGLHSLENSAKYHIDIIITQWINMFSKL